MGTSKQQGPAINIGYPWSLQLQADGPMFSADNRYVMHVRYKVTDADTIAVLDTEDSTLVRVDDYNLLIQMPREATTGMAPGFVVMDLGVLEDGGDVTYAGIYMEVPVKLPVTRLP